MFLIVFYGGIIFPGILCRKENCLYFPKNIPGDDVLHIPSVLKVQEREIPVSVQTEFLQISVV